MDVKNGGGLLPEVRTRNAKIGASLQIGNLNLLKELREFPIRGNFLNTIKNNNKCGTTMTSPKNSIVSSSFCPTKAKMHVF
jgi:hypothetical protein